MSRYGINAKMNTTSCTVHSESAFFSCSRLGTPMLGSTCWELLVPHKVEDKRSGKCVLKKHQKEQTCFNFVPA